MRRIMLGVSQEKLGTALGITFQQVQKYENGTNRVSASRMQSISQVLEVSVSFFFEGAPGAAVVANANATSCKLDDVTEFISSVEGLAIARAFGRIKDVRLRRRIVELVEALTGKL